MAAWIGLIGTLIGAGATLLSQYLVKRPEKHDDRMMLMVARSAQLVALANDYRNRIWEERSLGVADRVSPWNLQDYRLAEAHISIVCRAPSVRLSLRELNEAGKELGRVWRTDASKEPEVEAAGRRHREALGSFIESSADYIAAMGKRAV